MSNNDTFGLNGDVQFSTTFGSQLWSVLKRHRNPFLMSDAEDRNLCDMDMEVPNGFGPMPITPDTFVLYSEAANTNDSARTDRHGPDTEQIQLSAIIMCERA